MNIVFKKYKTILISVTAIFVTGFFSCQKAELNPYSPDTALTHTVVPTYTTTPVPPDTTPSFKASVNGSSVITFIPSKSISGSNTILKGVSTYYTITITIPSSTGPGGPYSIGFGGPGITAALINGSTTYVANDNWGTGFLTIDSISTGGKYYGSFDFNAEDTVSFNSATVNQGSFYHL